MASECGVILKLGDVIKSCVYDVMEYVSYIRSCEGNLDLLHKSLDDLCNKKEDIKRKVRRGIDKQEEITKEAARWLQDVRILGEDEKLKGLVYNDIDTGKFVVKMMGKKDFKRCLIKEHEMQELAIKVMKKLKEEMETSEEEEMAKMRDYKKVAKVVVEVMKDTFEEFKTLLKKDKNMAAIAMRTLKGTDLDKLTKGDKEMEEIVSREAEDVSDEELWGPNEDVEESNALSLVPDEGVDVKKNKLKEVVNKMFTPLSTLLNLLEILMDDATFKKAVPQAEGVKLGLEVINRLFDNNTDNTRQNRGCCICSVSLCDYHGRYLISKAAEVMAKHIKDEFIVKCPQDPVTLCIRTVDLKPIPTQFLKGLDSRTKLLDQILEKLNDDQLNAVGLFGMGGTGKTTMAKEIMKKVKDIFNIIVMVEVSHVPDIIRIQKAIAESIDLPLQDVQNVAQRAIRLYNRLIVEKEKTILIILDNVWKKLNLSEIGIPSTCKFLLTTRERDVCRVMDVHDVNMLEVGLMNTDEARVLFKHQGGYQVDAHEYKNVVKRLLIKCGGLPLTIVATATLLKGKDLRIWEKFADDLEKPISSQVIGDLSDTYSVLDTSYKFIHVNEKRIFFLLACLSPVGSGVSIENLIRYGIGLNLFPNVNKLSEATELADIWANELLLSSMLIEGDAKGELKVHDIVRAFAISFAAKEDGHKFLVEGIPRWLDDETFNEYTTMALRSRDDYSRLSGVEAMKLQILILKGDMSPNFDDFFFEGMANLKVLAMSNMNFSPSLPESLRKLKKLRVLCMERCKLGDIKKIGELVNLLVLSLRESFFEELPVGIEELSKLRLLDLTRCSSSNAALIPTSVLSRLSKLEGLYLSNSTKHGVSVFGTEMSNEGWGTIDKCRLPCLNAININVRRMEGLPIDAKSFENIDKFRVYVTVIDINDDTLHLFDRVLHLEYTYNMSELLEKSCLKTLIKRADYLYIRRAGKDVRQIVPLLDKDGFKELSSLAVIESDHVECIVNRQTTSTLTVFPRLQSLYLSALWSLKMVCDGKAPPGMFSNLKSFVLDNLSELSYGLPLVPRNLIEISVTNCPLLNSIFLDDEETRVIELSFLKALSLSKMPNLLSLVCPKVSSNNCDTLPRNGLLFDGKIVFPKLELFEMNGCDNIGYLWSNESCGFKNLKDVEIKNCKKLLSLCSLSLFSTLVNLETLKIQQCVEMREVISVGEKEASERGEEIIRVPHLKYLELGALRNLAGFYGGKAKFEFPELKTLILYDLLCLTSFVNLDNPSSLFSEKIDFPCLEELQVRRMSNEVTGLWDSQASNPAPRLRHIELGTTKGLRRIPSVILENQSSLELIDFEYEDVLFSSSDVQAKEQFVWTYSQLLKLEELKVENSKSLKELFKVSDDSGVDALAFCGQLKKLTLNSLPSLNLIPLHLLNSLTSLTLFGLNWEHLVSADMLGNSLQQLEYLSVVGCWNMEAFVIDVISVIELPRLKTLILDCLSSTKSFSSKPKTEATLRLPSLESLSVASCGIFEPFWIGSFFAPKLQDLSLSYCDNLEQIFKGNPQIMTELPSLRKVEIMYCKKFKSISSGPLNIPKLREVRLYCCDDLECFLLGNSNFNGPIELRFLEVVNIAGCPKLHSMSLTPLRTPNLTHVQHSEEEYSMLQFDDLNHFLQNVTLGSSF